MARLAILTFAAVMRETASMASHLSRRQTLQRGSLAAVVPLLAPTPALASTKTDAEKVLEALQPLSGFVDDGKWDAVRTVLATSPIVELWKTGNSKNWIRAAALSAGDPELIELSEDLSSALQLTDQYVYDNNFIYFQPGNGKARPAVSTKSPGGAAIASGSTPSTRDRRFRYSHRSRLKSPRTRSLWQKTSSRRSSRASRRVIM